MVLWLPAREEASQKGSAKAHVLNLDPEWVLTSGEAKDVAWAAKAIGQGQWCYRR